MVVWWWPGGCLLRGGGCVGVLLRAWAAASPSPGPGLGLLAWLPGLLRGCVSLGLAAVLRRAAIYGLIYGLIYGPFGNTQVLIRDNRYINDEKGPVKALKLHIPMENTRVCRITSLEACLIPQLLDLRLLQ